PKRHSPLHQPRITQKRSPHPRPTAHRFTTSTHNPFTYTNRTPRLATNILLPLPPHLPDRSTPLEPAPALPHSPLHTLLVPLTLPYPRSPQIRQPDRFPPNPPPNPPKRKPRAHPRPQPLPTDPAPPLAEPRPRHSLLGSRV